jgi:type II secretory pathway component PulJ
LVQLVDHEWFYSTKGFTLVEALVTMGVSMAVVGAVATFMLHSARLSTVLVQRTAESVAAKNRLVKCEADIAQAPFDEEEPPASCADVSVTVESSVTAPFSGMTCLTFALDTPGPGGTVLRSLVHGYNCRLVWTELGTLPTESEEEAQ